MSLATLTTGISTMLQKLSELFSAQRAPAGYRPGVTLEYLRRNLGTGEFYLDRPGRGRADSGGSRPSGRHCRAHRIAIADAPGHDRIHDQGARLRGGQCSLRAAPSRVDSTHGIEVSATGGRPRFGSQAPGLPGRGPSVASSVDGAGFQDACKSIWTGLNGRFGWNIWAVARWSTECRPFVVTSP